MPLGALDPLEVQTLRLVVREALASPPRLARLVRRFRRGHLPLLAALARDGVASGVFREELPIPLLMAALAALGGPAPIALGFAERTLSPRVARPIADRPAALVDLLIRGVGAPGLTRRSPGGRSASRRGGRRRPDRA